MSSQRDRDRDRDGDGAGVACQECPGPPPPRFSVPPPPRPPFLQEEGEACQEEPLLPYEFCDLAAPEHAEEGARGVQPLPATTVVAIGCSLLLVAVLTATALLWKYRRKIPCKAAGGDRRDGYCAAAVAAGRAGGGAGPTVEYADLTEIRPPPRTSAALQQVLLASSPRSRALIPRNLVQMQAMPQPRPHRRPHEQMAALCPDYQQPSDLYNPVYNEISNSSDEYLPSDRGDEEDGDGGDSSSGGGGSASSLGARTYCSAEQLSPAEEAPPPLRPPPSAPPPPVPPPGPAAAALQLRYLPSAPPIHQMTDSPPGHESDSGYSHHSSSGQRRPNTSGIF